MKVNSYYFTAISKEKKKIKGYIDANNEEELKKIISFHEYYLLSFKKKNKKKRNLLDKIIRTKDIKDLCDSFSRMLKTNQTLYNVLKILEASVSNKGIKEILKESLTDIYNGKCLSYTLKKYKKYFSNFFISMVEVGEETNNLSDVFTYLGKYYEEVLRIKSKIINSLLYPSILFILSIVVFFVMCVFVLPTYREIFIQNNIELPLYTRILFDSSYFIKENLFFVVGILILSILMFSLIIVSTKTRQFILSILKKLIVINKVFKLLNVYLFSRNMQILLESKLTINQSLSIIVETINDKELNHKLMWVSDEVKRGQKLSNSLKSINYFSSFYLEMVRNGENNANLSIEFKSLSDYYFNKLNDTLLKLSTFIEPTIIIIMSLFIGLMMLSIFIPMLNLLTMYN